MLRCAVGASRRTGFATAADRTVSCAVLQACGGGRTGGTAGGDGAGPGADPGWWCDNRHLALLDHPVPHGRLALRELRRPAGPRPAANPGQLRGSPLVLSSLSDHTATSETATSKPWEAWLPMLTMSCPVYSAPTRRSSSYSSTSLTRLPAPSRSWRAGTPPKSISTRRPFS